MHRTFNEKYVPNKNYKEFTGDLKNIYGAVNVETAKKTLINFVTNGINIYQQ